MTVQGPVKRQRPDGMSHGDAKVAGAVTESAGEKPLHAARAQPQRECLRGWTCRHSYSGKDHCPDCLRKREHGLHPGVRRRPAVVSNPSMAQQMEYRTKLCCVQKAPVGGAGGGGKVAAALPFHRAIKEQECDKSAVGEAAHTCTAPAVG